jgi:hypothetical protein
MHVVLVHGMGRSPRALAPLGRRLREAGHTTSFFAYGVRTSALGAIVNRFVRETRPATEAGPWALVGHSLGNLVYRLAERELSRPPERAIMLAPPNRGSAAARLVSQTPLAATLFAALTGDAGRRLADPGFCAALPRPAVPVTIFAGDRGPRLPLPFAGAPNDGLVSVEETRLEGADVEHEVVPAIHTFIMNDPRVVQRTLALLRRA